jgi:lysozyme family protein
LRQLTEEIATDHHGPLRRAFFIEEPMAATSFPYCEKTVLAFEGGKVNNPNDPGGRTNEGVIQRVYDGWRRRKGLALRSVYEMEGAERDDIYRNQYWVAVRGDELPAGVDLAVYDGAVNSGPAQATKWLQRALGVTVDGHIGEATLRALEECTDMDGLVRKICARRLAFMRALRAWPTFGKGWTRRVAAVQRASLCLAAGAVAPAAGFIDGGHVKARLTDAKPVPQTASADAAATGGGVTATLTQASSAIEPLADKSDHIAMLFTALTVLGVLVTVAGLVWGMVARNRRAAIHDALDIVPAAPVAINDSAAADHDVQPEAA